MNPELIERPYETAYYRQQRLEKQQERITVGFTFLLLAIGFISGWFWRFIFELIL